MAIPTIARGIKIPARTEEIVKTISEVWRTAAGTVVRKKVEVG
jgi:hypothetical protein